MTRFAIGVEQVELEGVDGVEVEGVGVEGVVVDIGVERAEREDVAEEAEKADAAVVDFGRYLY